MASGGKRVGAGRPAGKLAKSTLQAIAAREFIAGKVIEEMDLIVMKAIAQAKKGDRNAREFLFDRAFSKPTLAIDSDPSEKEKEAYERPISQKQIENYARAILGSGKTLKK